MPKAAPSPCRTPGCANTTTSGYCEDHIKEATAKRQIYLRRSRARRRNDTQQHQLDKFYHTPAWRACRKAYISAHPICAHCEATGRVVPADVVDHIVERRDGGANYDHTNLQALCHGCHNSKTQTERRNRNGD